MGSFEVWLEVLSWTKALFEATTLGADLYKPHDQHLHEKDTIAEARRCSSTDTTYSPGELDAILKRLQACRDRFVSEGGGEARRGCLCSVFKDIMAGDGGRLTRYDNWQNMFRQLNCPKAQR